MPRYYTTGDWWTAGGTALTALIIYWITLAPTITLEYSGQLVVAAHHLGVARPPGYPVWHMLAKLFTCVFSFVEYHGHSNPAWAVNFMSAVFGSLACGTLALIISRETQRLFPSNIDIRAHNLRILCAAAAFTAALLFGVSHTMWSQSVIAETHTLTNFYILAFMSMLLYWIETKNEHTAYGIAFLLGLGLAVTPSLVLMAPIVLLAATLVSFKSFVRFAEAVFGFLSFVAAEFVIGSRSPWTSAIVLAMTLLIVLALLIPRPSRTIGIMLTLMIAGLIPFAYLPIAASHHAPMNMGYACTWEGFWHVLHRGQYERLSPINPFADIATFKQQLDWYWQLAASQFTRPIQSIALVPMLSLPFVRRGARKAIVMTTVALFLFSFVVLVGANPKMDNQTTYIVRVIFIPSFAQIAILIGYGLVIMLDGIGDRLIWKK